ncbi:Calx-beta domain-containing protein, partial [Azonexus hydrophilus]|uniref:Calx-beta domain-containing protein n=1 Tax=Azonexus hydrophilus TaxID=418702 RepID=UPI0019632BD3
TYSFTTGGSATSGTDYDTPTFDKGVTYDATTQTITVPAGVGSFTVSYPTIDDTDVEANETLTVTIDGVTGTGTILDNDKPGISGIEPNRPGVSDDQVEEGQPLSYTVTLTEPTTQPTTYSFTTGGSATSGTDYDTPTFDKGVTYDATTQTITVPAGVGSFTVSYPTIDDTDVEANETLTVTIDGVTGTGTILDNDKPGISGI